MEHKSSGMNSLLRGKSEKSLILDTKGCCFMCLSYSTENNIENSVISSMKNVFRHLNIIPEQSTNINADLITDVEVKLCGACAKLVTHFENLHFQLETVKMKLDYCMQNLHQAVTENQRNPQVVQIYLQLMSSDKDSLFQLDFADKLRKELGKQTKKLQNLSKKATVQLTRVTVAPEFELNQFIVADIIKEEIACLKEELADDYYDGWDNYQFSSENQNKEEDDNKICSENSTETSASPIAVIIKSEESISPTVDEPPNLVNSSSENPIKLQIDNLSISKSCAKMHKCSACDKQFKEKASVVDHFRKQHMLKKCRFCKQASFSTFSEISSHWKICPQAKSRQVSSSGQLTQSQSKQTASSSKKSAIKYIFDKETCLFKCRLCNEEFPNKSSVWDHYNKVHLSLTFKCNLCSATYSRARHLSQHKKRCHKKFQNQKDIHSYKLTHLPAQLICKKE